VVPLSKKRHLELVLLVGVLLLATLLRLWALGDVPPGLEHDEVANWLIARDILSGHHAVYFTAAYGHEALWQYVQAGTVALLGDNWLGLRSASVVFGLLSVLSTYLLTRRLFGSAIALNAAAWLAVSFWHLFYSRVALRAISLPALSALGAYFLWRDINKRQSTPTPPDSHPARAVQRLNQEALLAGLFFGLSAYTYMAARALPFILAGLVFYLALFHRETLRRGWRGLALTLLVAAIVAAPLVHWLLTHPGAEHRIGEVNAPLNRLLAGDPGPVLDNALALLKMWSIRGDPWDRQNVPGRPVFVEPLGALLFYGGVLVALWRVRQPRYGFILIWLAASLLPSLVTSVAPSSIRTINALAVVYIFPGIALKDIRDWKLGILRPKARQGLLAVGVLALALNLWLTARDYFVRWPEDAGVQFVFQSGLTEIARDLDADPDDSPVAVAGLSVDTMDPPTFATTLRRQDLTVRWFDARKALVIPGDAPSGSARLFVPHIVPLAAPLQARLSAWDATSTESEQYVRYVVQAERADLAALTTTATLPDGETPPPASLFGGQVKLVGYEWLAPTSTSGQTAEMLTYWRVVTTPSPPLKIFVHLIPSDGQQPVAQNDGLGSPPNTWRSGDLLIRYHPLALPAGLPPGLYQPQIGWYNPDTNERLPVVSDGVPLADRLLLKLIEVVAP
jgi:4-amino-4-deoxy-L-arabinose transferase-like glycosyltransferase